MSFYDKYMDISKKNKSYVCVGLDSDLSKLPLSVSKEKKPMLVFNKRIIDETYKYANTYKPNVAFYLSKGIEGIEILKETIDYIPKENPVIFDLKAGDIGNTMEQYAISAFNYFKADAMTINILMGSDVIEACLKIENSYCFILALTSNPSAIEYFKHDFLYRNISNKIKLISPKRIGAVVGATRADDFIELRGLMPESIFLVPGIGVQGGDLATLCRNAIYKNEDARILVNSSRGIIFADSSENFAKVAGIETKKLRDNINENLSVY